MKHDDLIEFCDQQKRGYTFEIPNNFWAAVIAALRECGEDKFDVREHLRQGGKINREKWCELNSYLHIHDGELCNRYNELAAGSMLMHDDFQPHKEPLEMPENNKVYWVTCNGHVQDTPYKWFDGSFIYSDGEDGYCDFKDGTFEVLRNTDNSLCECVVPDVKGGL